MTDNNTGGSRLADLLADVEDFEREVYLRSMDRHERRLGSLEKQLAEIPVLLRELRQALEDAGYAFTGTDMQDDDSTEGRG